VLYRIASVLLLLFAAGHTFGFRQNNPEWGADAVLGLMRSIHFDAQGFSRTYWDFFSAFGLFFSLFLLFAAVLAWLLGGLPAETLARVRSIAWALAICFVAVTALSWRYAFTTPIVFSTLITVCLIAAAWLSAKPRSGWGLSVRRDKSLWKEGSLACGDFAVAVGQLCSFPLGIPVPPRKQ
jgi:hypothetical protein